ncbi:hypothetical protein J2S47_004305 [Streptomyces griseoviridis]|uniref:Uncharacterized protein n=1 Tax=Streptomyces griseoviridis TaxID=45398 RepID=A0ABT9LJC1_STRGD|nr:hypothetical protein [Streptomyces griseoviridis]
MLRRVLDEAVRGGPAQVVAGGAAGLAQPRGRLGGGGGAAAPQGVERLPAQRAREPAQRTGVETADLVVR